MEEKFRLTELKEGAYYRFYYKGYGYVVGRSKDNYICFFGIRDTDIYGSTNELWLSACTFGAADYATLAPEEEIAWLAHCVRSGKHITLASFMKDHYSPAEVSNYPIF
jgi:hypothetical protein